MKQKLLTLFLALAASVGTLFALSGTCGTNLTWTLNTQSGTLTISGTGAMTDYTYNYSYDRLNTPWYSYRSSIKTVIIEDGVTTIGNYAFYNCSSLTSVTIPNSVTSIGDWAFYDCSSLTSVTIPNSVTSIGECAFIGCTSLNSITIPNSVTIIGRSAFNGCRSLTSIIVDSKNPNYCDIDGVLFNKNRTELIRYPQGKSATNYVIPSSVTSIGDYAFSGCTSLTSITIPNGVTSIGHSAFSTCSSLTSVTIPSSVTSIGDYAFSTCRSLTSITIPNSVTSIGHGAFGDCTSLTSITIPNSVTSIGEWAFYECSSLTSVTIPNSVTSIGERAFWGCTGLTSITIPTSVTSIGSSAFYGVLNIVYNGSASGSPWGAKYFNCYVDGYFVYSDDTKTELLECLTSAVGEITIPNSVTTIGSEAFRACSSLTSITIPNSVTSIGEGAFYGCSSLTSPVFNAHVFANMPQSYSGAYTIPDGIESIAGGAFEKCSSLTSITIPNSVTTIGDYAFDNCSSLTSITIPNSVTSIGERAFYNCSSLPIIDGIRYADTYLVKAVDKTLSTYTIKEGTRWIGDGAFSGCYNMKSVIMESATPPSVSTSSFPNKTIVYVPLGSLKAYQDDKNWKNYDLRLFDTTIKTSAVSPTSAAITFSASLNGEDKNKYIAACGIEDGEEFSGNTAEYIGLEPESEYADVPFYIRTTKGDIQTIPLTFTTSALELITLAPKAVSNTTSILLAETNMSDAETSCGFEWRRNDQPADMPSNQVLCPVANGLMAGRLKGLKDDVYYKYRAFYKSAAGNMFYGDWQYVFTGDVTVEFDPVLYTYAAQFVSERKATLKGYALAGSDDFTEQGFEYWAESRRTDAPARRAPQYAIGEKHTVTGTGISMRVTLEDLDEGTVYKYRTYAKVGNKTLYGTEMSFTTQGTYEEPVVTDLETVNDADDADGNGSVSSADAPQARKVMENNQVYIILPDGRQYDLQGKAIR